MKDHILAALREQLEAWQEFLASLDETQITAPQFDLGWSVKDVMAHLWAWQQISIARLKAGVQDTSPVYPAWILGLGENWEENSNRVNSLTYELTHDKPWLEIYEQWQIGFLQFLKLGDGFSEKDLLDSDLYHWLNGYSLASILLASYDHHQEHIEKLTAWRRVRR